MYKNFRKSHFLLLPMNREMRVKAYYRYVRTLTNLPQTILSKREFEPKTMEIWTVVRSRNYSSYKCTHVSSC